MPAWISVGAHRCYVEGSLFVMELHGPVSRAEVAVLLAPQDELLGRCADILTLCDAREATLPSPEVRRYLSERGQRLGKVRIRSVVITTSLMLRTALSLVERASMLLTGRPLDTCFVGSEEAAWAWIAARQVGSRPPASSS
jgi:hypothetical protein